LEKAKDFANKILNRIKIKVYFIIKVAYLNLALKDFKFFVSQNFLFSFSRNLLHFAICTNLSPMKNIKYIIFTVVLLSACKKTDHKPQKENNADVYVVGYSDAVVTGYPTALYFKNGKFINLDKGSTATAICLQDTNVYIVGSYDVVYASYWKNGIVTNINDFITFQTPYTIAVSGTDVYLGGLQVGGGGYKDYNTYEIYWKNGVTSDKLDPHLPNELDLTNCSIAVDGADLYLAGTSTSLYNSVYSFNGVYWKNNHPVYLTTTSSSMVFGMTVSGGIVYCAGRTQVDNAFVATYWKNTTPIQLEPATTYAVAYCIAVSVSDVYVGGIIYVDQIETACYWKNGVRHKVADNARVTSIAVDGSDVYCAGYNELPNNITKAAYWKNDTPQPLTSIPANSWSSVLTGIAVRHR
jgi:hypothetical protein